MLSKESKDDEPVEEQTQDAEDGLEDIWNSEEHEEYHDGHSTAVSVILYNRYFIIWYSYKKLTLGFSSIHGVMMRSRTELSIVMTPMNTKIKFL